mgnify:CR=1 FL=1
MVATSFTELHGEDRVLSFQETVERQQQTMTSREIAELPRELSLSLRLRKRLLREYPQLAPQKVARRLALDGFIALAPDALFPLGGYPGDEDKARAAFIHLLDTDPDITIYGVTSGYGQHASKRYTGDARRAHAQRPPRSPAVAFGETAPERVARGIVLARLANFIEGHAAITPALADAVAALLDGKLPLSGPEGTSQFVIQGSSQPGAPLWTALLWLIQGQANEAQVGARRSAEAPKAAPRARPSRG